MPLVLREHALTAVARLSRRAADIEDFPVGPVKKIAVPSVRTHAQAFASPTGADHRRRPIRAVHHGRVGVQSRVRSRRIQAPAARGKRYKDERGSPWLHGSNPRTKTILAVAVTAGVESHARTRVRRSKRRIRDILVDRSCVIDGSIMRDRCAEP
jgi:hypothetical protein